MVQKFPVQVNEQEVEPLEKFKNFHFKLKVPSRNHKTTVLHSYNKSQRDAIFIKFIWKKNSTCFVQIYGPLSGVSTLYLQQ
jgi:hypothetical protein